MKIFNIFFTFFSLLILFNKKKRYLTNGNTNKRKNKCSGKKNSEKQCVCSCVATVDFFARQCNGCASTQFETIRSTLKNIHTINCTQKNTIEMHWFYSSSSQIFFSCFWCIATCLYLHSQRTSGASFIHFLFTAIQKVKSF